MSRAAAHRVGEKLSIATVVAVLIVSDTYPNWFLAETNSTK